MSSDMKLFIPGKDYSGDDLGALLQSVSGDRRVTLSRFGDSVSQYPNTETGEDVPYATFSGYRVSLDDGPVVVIHVESRKADLTTLGPDSSSYFGIDHDSKAPRHVAGLSITCPVYTSEDRKWVNTLLADIWKTQGGYFIENDSLSDDYVFSAGVGNSLLSDTTRAQNIAQMWKSQIALTLKSDLENTLTPGDIELLQDGFKALAESVIESSLAQKRLEAGPYWIIDEEGRNVRVEQGKGSDGLDYRREGDTALRLNRTLTDEVEITGEFQCHRQPFVDVGHRSGPSLT